MLLGPMEAVAFGQHHALQVLVLGPLPQPLLFQETHQLVSFLYHLHDLHQELLLLIQVPGALQGVCKAGEHPTLIQEECIFIILGLSL